MSKQGKNGQKYGRNKAGKRAGSNALQAVRTTTNKAKRVAKDKALKAAAKAKQDNGFVKGSMVAHGTKRQERRTKAAWYAKMSAAKAKKQAQRVIAEAARRGGHITVLPDAQSLAIVAAWAKAKALRQAKVTCHADKE